MQPIVVMFVLALLAALVLNHGDRLVVGSVESIESVRNRWVSETHWPSRGWMYKLFPMPVKTGAIDRPAELAYFVTLMRILDDGITHRINIDGVLQTSRPPAEYERLYALYRARQSDVLARLEKLEAPARLEGVHERIHTATVEQIRFYERFMQAKAKNASVDLPAMLGDPSLRTANAELHAAWDEIRRLYPRLDPISSAAIELRFCGFDPL